MNLHFKDELNGQLALSTAQNWFDKNGNKPLSTYCVIINFGSPMDLEADLTAYQIKKNDMSFLNPGSYISSLTSRDDKHYFIDFNSAFYCLEIHDKELSCNGLLFGALPYLPIIQSSDDEAKENAGLLEIMVKEFGHDDNTQGDMLRILLKRLIIICVRIGRQQLFNIDNPQKKETDIIRSFQALVEKHFKEKHKVADYADMMFRSPKTLSNTFKKLGNSSPLQIIQERIILEAKRQIYYTDKTIKDISYELGFSEPAQFSRLFKNITGLNPSEFQFPKTGVE